jgi:hypothetical protein
MSCTSKKPITFKINEDFVEERSQKRLEALSLFQEILPKAKSIGPIIIGELAHDLFPDLLNNLREVLISQLKHGWVGFIWRESCTIAKGQLVSRHDHNVVKHIHLRGCEGKAIMALSDIKELTGH